MNPGGAARRVATPALLTATLLSAPALLALHFKDGPPARVTGGFGEESCVSCHFGSPVNASPGDLELTGFPERYLPGATYELELTLTRPPELAAAGFQLAIRHSDGGKQAGTIEVPPGQQARISLLDDRGIRFAHHRLVQAATQENPATVTWELSWTAPTGDGRIVAHASAVAADGDDSQLGDLVYTVEAVAVPD